MFHFPVFQDVHEFEEPSAHALRNLNPVVFCPLDVEDTYQRFVVRTLLEGEVEGAKGEWRAKGDSFVECLSGDGVEIFADGRQLRQVPRRPDVTTNGHPCLGR